MKYLRHNDTSALFSIARSVPGRGHWGSPHVPAVQGTWGLPPLSVNATRSGREGAIRWSCTPTLKVSPFDLRCILFRIRAFNLQTQAGPRCVGIENPFDRVDHPIKQHSFNPNVVVEILDVTCLRHTATDMCMNGRSCVRG